MATAFQVEIGGNTSVVTYSFHSAMRHLAVLMIPDPIERASFVSLEEFPELASEELGGSYHQRIRHAINGRAESVRIVMHDMEAVPGNATTAEAIDLAGDFDPAYALQAALYRASMTDEDLDGIAHDLQTEIYDGVRHARRFNETDQQFVGRLRLYGSWMGGNAVIPDNGEPARILKDLPAAVRLKFEELARKAFPQEAMAI